jgi:predicted site-specific integrase-resolvase
LIKLRRVAVSHRQRLGNEGFELVETLVSSHVENIEKYEQ